MGKKKADVSLIIMILAIVAVLVLGGFAIAPQVKTAIENRKQEAMFERIDKGEGTVEDYALMQYGMTADEFISAYGLKGQVNKDSLWVEALEKFTLKNFWALVAQSAPDDTYKYSDENLEAFKAYYEEAIVEIPDAEKVEITADTTDMTAKGILEDYINKKMSEAMNGPVEVNPETDEVEVPAEGDDIAESVTEPTTEATAATTPAAE